MVSCEDWIFASYKENTVGDSWGRLNAIAISAIPKERGLGAKVSFSINIAETGLEITKQGTIRSMKADRHTFQKKVSYAVNTLLHPSIEVMEIRC